MFRFASYFNVTYSRHRQAVINAKDRSFGCRITEQLRMGWDEISVVGPYWACPTTKQLDFCTHSRRVRRQSKVSENLTLVEGTELATNTA